MYNDKVHRISDYKKYGHTYCDTGEILHQWSVGSIYGILQNTNYLGSLQPYKSEKRLHEEKDSIFYTKEDEEEAVHHTHQAIVSVKLFEKVQNRLKIKMSDKKTQYKSKYTENIYRNILYCGNCGKVMHSVYYQSRKKDERHYSYYCKRAYFIDHRKCEKNYIREEQVTSLVQKQLCNTFKEQQIEAKDFIKLNMDECDRRIAEYERKGGKIAKEFEYMKKQAAMMYGRYKEGEITKEEYLAFKQNKKEQDNYAKKSLEEMKQKIRRAKDKAEEENKFLCSLLKADICKTLNIQLVEAFMEKISIFSNGVVDIVYTFSKGEE
ncbi:MAG: recombinase family protein [Lachnospiraceae bacterium]|nr:recombinase family protein [Lachnospiraceae bacterium]